MVGSLCLQLEGCVHLEDMIPKRQDVRQLPGKLQYLAHSEWLQNKHPNVT